MLFYWFDDIPNCELTIDQVEEWIWERFRIYCSSDRLQNDDEDRIAHFFMCVFALDFCYFKDMFINGEVKIFKEKVKQNPDLKKELSQLLQNLKSVDQEEVRGFKNLRLVCDVIQTILSRSNHVFKNCHSRNCRKFKMTLPFTFPLKLIAKREIELSQGKAAISCGNWNKIIELIFEFSLEVELFLLKKSEELKKCIYFVEDDRIRQIINRFVNFYNGTTRMIKFSLKAEEIDDDARYFPPCMANLHQILRQTHRLSYESRYQYTLFLRDIGLSVEENISLWEDEYSKPHEGSTCTHEWEEKQKRYIYQIQHLYGLVGSQELKTSHSCDKFTGVLLSKMDGGCPFQHLSEKDLEKALPRKMKELPDVEDIFKYKSLGLPQKCCAVYLECQKKLVSRRDWNFSDWSISKVTYIVSPLHYYNSAKSSNV